MSILTKTCIVVLVIVVLLACPVFVMKATVDPIYRDRFEQEQLKSKLAEQDAAHTKVALALAAKERDVAVERAAEAEARRVRDMGDLATVKAQVENDLAAMKTTVAQLTARLEAAQAISQSAVARASSLDVQAGKDRTRISVLVQDNAQLKADVRTTQGRFDLADKLLRIAREDLGDLEKRYKELLARGGARVVTGEAPVAPADISAAIATVLKTGIASIDVGSARGIRRGMKLVIHRDGQFLAYLRITLVSPDDSAGLVVGKRADVKPGDRVSSEARFKIAGG